MELFDRHRARYQFGSEEELTLQGYLEVCKQDRTAYAHAAERLLEAIGEPETVDTRQDPRLSRIFSTR